jgi:hypothetical protein
MDLSKLGPINLDASYLLVSLLWSTVGGGFWIYGKKSRTAPPLFGGIALIAISWIISSAVWMSVAAVAIIFGIWYWAKNSD